MGDNPDTSSPETSSLPSAASSRPVVVLKFGGTSLASADGRAAVVARVANALEQGRAPVVVVSAMGRAGAPYATDTLLALVESFAPDPRERDLIASCGEVISAVVLAHELRAAGIDGHAYTGGEAGIVTDGAQEEASVTEVYRAPLHEAIARGEVPVVCGFQGVAEDGRLTTLGRGGSDTTACTLGVALEAESVEIYTDVDGVMSADPRACDSAVLLATVGADELFQMARHGARVVHTAAAQLALASGIGVRVRNTFSDRDGTLVADIGSYRPTSVATAVTHTCDVVRFRVALPAGEGTLENQRAQADVYRVMADAGVSLDMFTPAGDVLVFSASQQMLDRAREALDHLRYDYELRTDLAKVTLVGAGMHGVPGVMARVAEYLSEAGVVVLQTADSHTTISVLVRAEDAVAAVRALHDGFELAG